MMALNQVTGGLRGARTALREGFRDVRSFVAPGRFSPWRPDVTQSHMDLKSKGLLDIKATPGHGREAWYFVNDMLESPSHYGSYEKGAYPNVTATVQEAFAYHHRDMLKQVNIDVVPNPSPKTFSATSEIGGGILFGMEDATYTFDRAIIPTLTEAFRSGAFLGNIPFSRRLQFEITPIFTVCRFGPVIEPKAFPAYLSFIDVDGNTDYSHAGYWFLDLGKSTFERITDEDDLKLLHRSDICRSDPSIGGEKTADGKCGLSAYYHDN
ncbi:MAG: hypothetical protein WC527_07555 [Candidatus Margulisiibacteriota bacterium]